MGRPKGAKAQGLRVELEVIGFDAMPNEMPEWEIGLVAARLRAIAAENAGDREDSGGADAAS